MREQFNDTAFRRHVLVQALILLDFMLSLTPKAKARLADLTNKSVLYGFVLAHLELELSGRLTALHSSWTPVCMEVRLAASSKVCWNI